MHDKTLEQLLKEGRGTFLKQGEGRMDRLASSNLEELTSAIANSNVREQVIMMEHGVHIEGITLTLQAGMYLFISEWLIRKGHPELVDMVWETADDETE